MSHILADTTAMVARAALPPTSAFVTLDSTWGAYLLGTCVSLVCVPPTSMYDVLRFRSPPCDRLYGVSLHQFYRYIRMYPTDTSFIRFIVSIDGLHTSSEPSLIKTFTFVCRCSPSCMIENP